MTAGAPPSAGRFFFALPAATIRSMKFALTRVLLAAISTGGLAACIHLPPEVAAVVESPDPAGQNHYVPDVLPANEARRGPD